MARAEPLSTPANKNHKEPDQGHNENARDQDFGGSMRGARGVDLLRVHELTGIPLELLLGADGLPAGPGRTVSGGRGS